MKRKIFIALLFIFTLTLFVAPVKLVKSDLPVMEKENFSDDYIFGGKELDFSGSAANIIFGGEKLTFSGNTKASIISLGKELILKGIIGNNVYAAGTRVLIDATVNGNIFVIGKQVTISKDAQINGTLFIVGKELKILGKVKGDLFSGSAELFIDNEIGGNANIGSGKKLTLSEKAKIAGNLKYQSDYQLTDSEKSRVSGTIDYKKIHVWENRNKNIQNQKVFFCVVRTIAMLAFIIGGLLLLLFPALKSFDERKSARNFWIGGAWGLIPFLIYPVVVIFLVLLGITIPLAIILLMSGLPVLFLTQFLGVVLTGQQLFNVFKFKSKNRFLYFLFASILFGILHLIPFFGVLTVLFFSSLGWGVILEALFKKKLV